MIKNTILEDHLNNHKNGIKTTPPKDSEKTVGGDVVPKIVLEEISAPTVKRSEHSLLIVLYQILEIVFKSFIFGYALQTLCKGHWTLQSIFAVGFTLNYIMFFLYKLSKKK
jgi:hypothetical protein